MTVFASRLNYNKLSDGYALSTCECPTQLSTVLVKDEQKLWRCNTCLRPQLHPRPEDVPPDVRFTEDVYPPPYVEENKT